jgi:hypothetical protein
VARHLAGCARCRADVLATRTLLAASARLRDVEPEPDVAGTPAFDADARLDRLRAARGAGTRVLLVPPGRAVRRGRRPGRAHAGCGRERRGRGARRVAVLAAVVLAGVGLWRAGTTRQRGA